MYKKTVTGSWRRSRRFMFARRRSRRFRFDGTVVSRIAAFHLLAVLAACAGEPTSHQLNNEMMRAVTSPIPGAQAQVLPAAAGSSSSAGATAAYCVTEAGYCPLAAAVEAGRNCLCKAGSLMYGGKTGAAPQTDTYEAPDVAE